MAGVVTQGIIPIIIFVVVLWAVMSGDKVYEHFTKGAFKGLRIAAELLPTLIGLLVGVGVLRASGAIEAFCNIVGRGTQYIGFPAQVCLWLSLRFFHPRLLQGLCWIYLRAVA